MQHLDDGLLHAYLDDALPLEWHGDSGVAGRSDADSPNAGTRNEVVSRLDVERHLSDCAECRAALEHALELKNESAAILSGAGPENVVMPSFEELQTRAKSGRTVEGQRTGGGSVTQSRRLVPVRTLAWAATVVLAAMVGWYARSALLTDQPLESLTDGEVDAQLTIPMPQTENQATAPESDEQRPTRPSAEPVEGTLQAINDVEQAAEAERTVDIGDVRSPQPVPEQPVEPSTTSGQRKGTPDSVSLVGMVSFDSGARTEGIARQPEERGLEEAPRARRSAGAAPAPMMAQMAGGLGAAIELEWTEVDETQAEEVLRRPVPKIAGLAVVGYATNQRNVRIVQNLDSGELIELVVFPSASEESAAANMGKPENPEVVNSMVVRRDDLVIRISAAVDADSLNTLSRKIVSH